MSSAVAAVLGVLRARVRRGDDFRPFVETANTPFSQWGAVFVEPAMTLTRGDAGRLERVIGHIVQNSLDATPADGRVWVTLRQTSGRVTLLVGDTGAGMDPEFIRNRLFRPFNSTKTSGMGIGSYESFQYIRELGGSIDVASEVGRGTQVTITLPLFDVRTASDLRPVEAK